MKSNIKELVSKVNGKRLTNKLVSEIIDVDAERSFYNKKTEVEYIDTVNITKLSDLEKIINDLREKYGKDVELEINSYEILIYDVLVLEETDSQVIERIKNEIKEVRKFQKQVENAKAKLAQLEG
jgi:vacuolar-type H+-ATPase subunit I/STV1